MRSKLPLCYVYAEFNLVPRCLHFYGEPLVLAEEYLKFYFISIRNEFLKLFQRQSVWSQARENPQMKHILDGVNAPKLQNKQKLLSKEDAIKPINKMLAWQTLRKP